MDINIISVAVEESILLRCDAVTEWVVCSVSRDHAAFTFKGSFYLTIILCFIIKWIPCFVLHIGVHCLIWGSHVGFAEDSGVLGCDALWFKTFWRSPSWTFEDEGNMIHEMSWTAYVNDTVSQSNWLESSAVLLREHRALHSVTFCLHVVECSHFFEWPTKPRVYKIASVVDRSVWFCGHSAGAHLVAMLLFSGWLHQLGDSVCRIAKGFVLISGVYDLTPLVSTYINDALKLSRQALC